MYCHELEKYLPDFIDNELPASLQQAITEHIEACVVCRAEIDAYRKTVLLVQLRSVPDPGEAYWEETWSAIQAAVPARTLSLPRGRTESVKRFWHGGVKFSRLALAAGIALFFVASVSGLFWYHKPHKTEAMNAREVDYIMAFEEEWGNHNPVARPIPIELQPEVEFSTYSRAALGAIDPISKSAVLIRVEAITK